MNENYLKENNGTSYFDLKNLILDTSKPIAWAITGGGHLLKESIDVIENILKNDCSMHIFFSRAAKEVVKIYGQYKRLKILKENYSNKLKFVFSDKQGYSFPICGSFSLKKYNILIVSPTTGNTVAKISYKIADTLITNIVSQSLKGKTPVIIIPTDFKEGSCETVSSTGQKITIYLHKSDIERTNALKKMDGIFVLESPLHLLI